MCFKLLAVTERKLCSGSLAQQLELIAHSPWKPAAVIVREKDLAPVAYRELLWQLRPICRQYGMELIVHGFWQLAAQEGITSLQLPLALLRSAEFSRSRRYFQQVGTSVHSLAEARKAMSLRADYLVAGNIFPTGCKPGLAGRGLQFLREVARVAARPVYAIGGIGFDAAELRSLRAAGAAGACIRSAYMLLGEDARKDI